MQETMNKSPSNETTRAIGRSRMADRGCAEAASARESLRVELLIPPGLGLLRDVSSINGPLESELGQVTGSGRAAGLKV